MVPAYQGVVFDLFAALLDSWSVWHRAAGSRARGERWRREYLDLTYGCGAYEPYEQLVSRAAGNTAMPRGTAQWLIDHYAEHRPWPEAPAILARLAAAGLGLGVATNCSAALGNLAAEQVGVRFDAVATAEDAGFYKPRPELYRLAARRLDLAPGEVLFVAGSAEDVPGATNAGMDVYWHNRRGLPLAESNLKPLANEPTLEALPGILGLA